MAAVEKKTVKIFSKEEIKKAESVDIYEFLGAHGSGELKGGGRYPKYYIKGHKSIVVDRKKNYFYHNGQHKGNNIIRLLMDYEGYNFRQSVSFLLGEEFEQHQGYDEEAEEQEEFKYPYKHEKTTERVKKYLVDERGIDREIVDYLIENGYVYQDKQYKSVVFAWRENGLANGEIVGATSQGTIIDHERYGKRGTAKFIAKNSKRNYGFNITLGNPEAYYFFESSIDLLSFWSTHKELTNCRLMSMEGLKKNSLIQYIQETYQNFNQLPKDGIFYGVDNDSAGHRLYDYAYHYLNIAKKKAGKATPNVNMIPFNNQISKEHFDLYQELSQEFPEATWEMLATIHKVETNMSNDNKIANEYDIQSALAISDKSEEKIGPIDVRAALTKIAATIQEKHLTPETLIRLYPDEKWNSTDQLFVNHKFERVYALYSEKNYEVVETVQNDWNDYVKSERAKGLITEKVPLAAKQLEPDFVYGQKKEEFTYYIQDSDSKMKIKEQLVDRFGIHPSIVGALVQKGMIRQDVNDRIIYLWNQSGTVVGGQIRGTFQDKKAFGRVGYEQKIMDLSLEGYGFNITLGKPNKITFFQTPEDLLSYWSLNVDQLKDTILFSLSDANPEYVANNINIKLASGAKIEKIEMCVGNNQSGMQLLDDVSQLEDFNLENRTLKTDQGEEIKVTSLRPKIGVNWLAELAAKRERVARLEEYRHLESQRENQYQRTQQQQNLSR